MNSVRAENNFNSNSGCMPIQNSWSQKTLPTVQYNDSWSNGTYANGSDQTDSSIQIPYHNQSVAYNYQMYATYQQQSNLNSNTTDYYANNFALRPTQQFYTDNNFSNQNNLNDSGKDIEAKTTSDENTSYDSNKENTEENKAGTSSTNNLPAYFTTQKIVNNTTKLSYTVYQLELLNAIYTDMKYPNSVQKTLIGKLIGITRDQVKIWFQNRRRKDTLVSQGKIPNSTATNGIVKSQSLKRRKSTDDFESYNEACSPCSPDEHNSGSSSSTSLSGSTQKKQVVETKVIDEVLYQLRSHQNAPSRLSTKRTKLSDQSSNPLKQIQNSNSRQINEKSICQSRIIDLCPILNVNKPNEESTIAPKVSNLLEINVNVPSEYSISSNNTSSGSSSLLIPTSSSSSSSNSSGSSLSSGEEEQPIYTPNQTFIKSKFQVMQQPFSIQDYVNNRYASQSYTKIPKITNEYQFDINSDYQPSVTINKATTWTPVDTTTNPSYLSYAPNQTKPNEQINTYESTTNQYNYSYMNQDETQHFNSTSNQAYVPTSTYLKPQFNSNHYQSNLNSQYYHYDSNNSYNYCA